MSGRSRCQRASGASRQRPLPGRCHRVGGGGEGTHTHTHTPPRPFIPGRREGRGRQGLGSPPRLWGPVTGLCARGPRPPLRSTRVPLRTAPPRAGRGSTNGKARGGRRRLLLAAAPAYIIGRRRRPRSSSSGAAGPGAGAAAVVAGEPRSRRARDAGGAAGGRLPARRWGGAGRPADGGGEGPGAAEAERSRTGRDGEAAGAPPALSGSLG